METSYSKSEKKERSLLPQEIEVKDGLKMLQMFALSLFMVGYGAALWFALNNDGFMLKPLVFCGIILLLVALVAFSQNSKK